MKQKIVYILKQQKISEPFCSEIIFYVILNYFKNFRLLKIGASLAFPEHTWKKQIISITKNTRHITAAAIGTIIVQQKTNEQIAIKIFIIVNFKA